MSDTQREIEEQDTAAAAAIAEEVDELLDAMAANEDEDDLELFQERLYDAAYRALNEPGGAAALYPLAPRFEAAGAFAGSDWEQPEGLQSGLVEVTMTTAEGVGVECCSQLRLLAIAEGETEHPRMAPEEARLFLERVLAFNLAALFPATPDRRPDDDEVDQAAVQQLFQFILDLLGVDSVMTRLVVEAERVLITRPIKIERIRRMIDTAARSVAAWGASEIAREAALLVDAIHGPTPLSRACETLDDYAAALAEMDDPSLLLEADTMGTYVRRSGLVSPQHALLVRFAAGHSRRLLQRALGLEETGRCCLENYEALVHELIETAVWPATAQSVYGLSQVLERGVLFHPPVAPGLRLLLDTPILDQVAQELLAGVHADDPPEPLGILVAGCLNVLGLPLGVDQGDNPTCQSARGISLWSQVEPGFLLNLIVQAARDGSVTLRFEGQPVVSSEVERGVADELHTELDSISLLLTPHLDRIYWQMSHLALDRGEDEHKWVNPEFHGWWVYRGFAAVIDEENGLITAPERFLRLFYASYHPSYNGGRQLMIPQPCGVAITNVAGVFLDWHAISIQRVEEDAAGTMRIYFFNPNHDKGQDWGQGVVTSTCDHDELMGESSLPFEQFASRLYVFHYDPRQIGELEAVPPSAVDEAMAMLRASWGRAFPWAEGEEEEVEA